jgi:solute:Na+ symporter, SSS family
VSQRAALAGLAVGLAGLTWIYFATSLAWPWYALVGSLLTVGAGLAASLIFPQVGPRQKPPSETRLAPPAG